PDGRPHGMSLILRDARMQERLEEQLRRSERLAAVSVMAAGLAHEVNNPLAIVANRIECMEEELRDGVDASVLMADVQVLREHTQRLQSVTRDLLRFTREYDEEPHPVDVTVVCRRVCRLLDRSLAARGMNLEVSADPVLPAVTGSEPALETVCMNLLLNAAEAMPDGGSISVRTRLADGEHAVEIIVEDSGPGIPAGLREKVFEPFFTTKEKQNGLGLGLGLALCRSIVERHEGRIWVEEGESSGCRFVVSIPRDVGEAA
ncbi:MAG: ATP-binding protein, partial [Gemmatimonadota bacterium]